MCANHFTARRKSHSGMEMDWSSTRSFFWSHHTLYMTGKVKRRKNINGAYELCTALEKTCKMLFKGCDFNVNWASYAQSCLTNAPNFHGPIFCFLAIISKLGCTFVAPLYYPCHIA